ncbi:MAG: lysylphosphatidylglycerol synthase domain-containing protein [Mycobacteriales bacterium]
MTEPSPRSRSRTLLRVAFLVAALVLVGLWVNKYSAQLGDAFQRTGLKAVLLSLLAALTGLLASAFCWRALLAALGSPMPIRLSLHVFFVGQIGKYLPGNVFAVAAQAELARDHGVPRSRIVTAGLVFLGVLTATGLLVAAAVLPFASPEVLRRYGWALVALPIGLVALAPPVLDRLIRVALKIVRRPAPERPLDRRQLLASVGWALVMWACYGVHLLPLVQAQPHESGHHLLLVSTGGYALAWTAGFLFVIAPAGAGVREAILVLALAGIAKQPEATAVALLSRGVQTLGDVLWAAVGFTLKRDVASR